MPYFILIIVAVSFSGGFYTSSVYCTAKESQRIEAINKRLIESNKRAIELEKRLNQQQDKQKTQYKTAIKYVTKYITKEQKNNQSVCAISPDIVRLLDQLRLSKPITDTTKKNTPAATTEELINYAMLIIRQYNLSAQQCNALIDFVSSR